MSVTRYAVKLDQCVEAEDGVFMLYSKHLEECEKLALTCRILRQRLIDVNESRAYFQRMCDLNVFTGY